MNDTLGDKVENAMKGAGIKARTFAALAGCHYTTIYDLLKYRNDYTPIRIVQESIYDVLDFLADCIKRNVVPLNNEMSVSAKTDQLKRMYSEYKNPANSDE